MLPTNPLVENAASLIGKPAAELPAVLESPDWSGQRRFCWEYYVPELIRGAWPGLSFDARLVALACATEQAERDDMDF